ncbi:MAG: NifU family protein [Bacteroidales bacterium]|nr:NifU family protein [Bacteroidales bacterium]MDE5736317.1 NifU family protein [Bacteroidales bacterium]MDE5742999.1 NifU family protein [Bacteroidales bacterium]MDE6514815.1 NifU family protein [Bacteroidales bacterium]MDE7090987.1 NifU family protein [Bacteroidales bacterium]
MEATQKTEITEKVRALIEQLRPYLQADGGDIAFMEMTDDLVVKVRLHGACGSCPHMQMTLKQGVEATLKKAIPEIKSVEAV